MKKFLLALFAVTITSAAFSQAFGEGSNRVHLGIGFGSPYITASAADSKTPPMHFSFEHGVTDKIGVGALVGFTGAKSTIPFFGEVKYRYIIVGARGAYHFITEDNLDVYGGAMLGYNIASVSFENESALPGFEPQAASAVAFGVFGGARYSFSEKIAVFGEVGYSIAWLSAGLCINLN